MNVRAIFGIALLVASGCSSSYVRAPVTEKLVFDTVAIHRFECYGRCPVYLVKVTSAGRVAYRGEKFVASVGERRGWIGAAALLRLSRAISELQYFSIRQPDLDACDEWSTDNPSVEIDVVDGERSHHVSYYYYGCKTAVGSGVDRLSRLVDEVTGVRQWTSGGAG